MGKDTVGAPSAIRTFLFTDVVGSTALWDAHPDEMSVALPRHDVLVEAAVRAHGGDLVRPRGEGDSRFAVFDDPAAAILGAVAVAEALDREEWPAATPIVVRCAVHTGPADLRAGDYYGSAVNRCARLRGIAHPGQVLVSDAALIAAGGAPDGVVCTDLGRHRLKDLVEAERVHQADLAGHAKAFPALRSLEAVAHNLPTQPTPLVGRADEVAMLVELLSDSTTRLVTLVGPGGIGKTRLAVQAAAELLTGEDDRVVFVDLSVVSDPTHVASAIASAAEVEDDQGIGIEPALHAALAAARVLLVVDNFEHVIGAATVVAGLLAAAPDCRVLVTSREPLRLRSEHVVPVPGLPTPGAPEPTTAADVLAFGAVELFVQVAMATDPTFALDDGAAPVVADICRRLDGIPLAIELAAARVRTLTPAALATRLQQALPILTGGARDLPERQRTLRATIAWSHDLLEDADRACFRRAGAFVGPVSIEVLESVCAGPPVHDVLDACSSLVDKSLLRPTRDSRGEPRFSMLETIREFARTELESCDEAAEVAARHAATFAERAQLLREPLFGGTASELPGSLLDDLPDIRAAIAHLDERDHLAAAEVATLAGTAAYRLGPVTDGLIVLGLVDPHEVPVGTVRAELLLARGIGRYASGASTTAAADLHAGVSTAGHDDGYLVVSGFAHLAFLAAEDRDHEAARRHVEAAIARAEPTGNARSLSVALLAGAYVARLADDRERAVDLSRRSLELARSVGDPGVVAYRQADLSRALCLAGAYGEALEEARAVVALSEDPALRTVGAVRQNGLGALGEALVSSGSPAEAIPVLAAAVELEQQLTGVAMDGLGWLGLALALSGRPDDGILLLGAWSAEADAFGGEDLPSELVERVRALLPPDRVDELWQRGRDERELAWGLVRAQLDSADHDDVS